MYSLFAPANEPQPVVIYNVNLIDSEAGKQGIIVNLLIYKYKLALVTRDNPPINDDTRIIDAQNGHVIVERGIGKPVTFLVFEDDPRIKKEILLDTDSTVKLVIFNGVVIRNGYPEIDIATVPDEEKNHRVVG